MELYHFTADKFIESILENGLTMGRVPMQKEGEIYLKHGFQWLTSNDVFEQSWGLMERSSLPYDRTANRLIIEIPKLRQRNLSKWMDACKNNQLAETLNSYGDPDNWYLYKGTVFPQWIKKVEHK